LQVSKSDILGLVSGVWDECFTEDLVKKAFEKLGIFSFNRDRYPTSRIAPHLLSVYNKEKSGVQQVSTLI